MDKWLDAAANYGLLGLVLLSIGAFVYAVWRWSSVNVIKVLVDNFIKRSEEFSKRQDLETASRVALNERLGIFMTVMAQHASAEEKRMLEHSNTMQQIAETQQRLALQKDTLELVASQVREVKSKQNGGHS